MSRPGSRTTMAGIGLILLVLSVAGVAAAVRSLYSGGAHRLVVTDSDTGRTVLEAPVSPGTRFVVKYTHSQTGGPMEMWFVIGLDRRIMLSEIRARILRPEIEDLTAHAREVVKNDGWTIYRGMNQVIDPLFIRVRVSAGEHSLVINGRETPLRSIADAGARLELRVK
ncbi:MAG: hypothetical protein ACM3ZU_14980 [Bacteroidota bacterium]